MKSPELELKPERSRPGNYDQVLSELSVKKPLLMKLLHLPIMELAKGNIKDIPEQFKGWSQDDFKALLKDLGYSVEEPEK